MAEMVAVIVCCRAAVPAVPAAGVTARDDESIGAAPGVAIRSTTFS